MPEKRIPDSEFSLAIISFSFALLILFLGRLFLGKLDKTSQIKRWAYEAFLFAWIQSFLILSVFLFPLKIPLSLSLHIYSSFFSLFSLLLIFLSFEIFQKRNPFASFLSFLTSCFSLLFSKLGISLIIFIVFTFICFFSYWKNASFKKFTNSFRLYFISTEGYSAFNLYPNISFLQPIDFRFDPENPKNLYVLERSGKLFKISEKKGKEKVLDFSDRVSYEILSEDGALGFALHPQFSEGKRFVYILYTHNISNGRINRLSAFHLDSQKEEILITLRKTFSHNGGGLEFGADGFLYFGIGFGQKSREDTQRIDRNLLSGIFRIDVDKQGGKVSVPIKKQPFEGKTQGYFIPKDNPFINQKDALGEFWALGLRNPFRFWIDKRNGEIWVGDVGWKYVEEVNRLQKGANAQWAILEGGKALKEIKKGPGEWTDPYYAYPHTASDRCVIGGFIYLGNKFPKLKNQYIFGENFGGYLASIPTEGKVSKHSILTAIPYSNMSGITTLRQSPDERILFCVMGSGKVSDGRILELVSEKGEKFHQNKVVQKRKLSSSEIYLQYCASCHGEKGDGKGFIQSSVALPDFRSLSWQKRRTDKSLMKIISQGGEKNGLDASMPAWENVLSKKEIQALVLFLRQFSENN